MPPTDEVYLWLGANVMLSYPMQEAESLLEGKLSGALSTLANCEEDLDFLREQITVSRLCDFRLLLFLVTDNMSTDVGSCNSKSLQLGCNNEKERERGAQGRW